MSKFHPKLQALAHVHVVRPAHLFLIKVEIFLPRKLTLFQVVNFPLNATETSP